MIKRQHLGAVLLVLIGATSYGLLSPVFKMAEADGWNVKSITYLQVLSGTLLLWLIFAFKGSLQGLKIQPVTLLKLVITGICGLSLTTVFYNQTLSRLDASLSIVLLFQYAWITILLESLRLRRWPAGRQWLAVALIFAGTLFAAGLLERDPGRLDGWGIIYGLLSAVTYGLFFFLSSYLPQTLEPIAKSAIMATASIVFITAIQGAGSFAGSGSVPIYVWGVLLGILGTVVPTICFNSGIPRIGAGLSALLGSLELPVAVLAAAVLLGEPLSWWQGAGILLILAGILAAERRQDSSPEDRPER
ncbi:DMT family transporter [Cohnella pontilimi]|uniref:DMT family transporter n=1 Tax=Cohnella pontilimi TaxID=2564100 RepID=A0A4U0FDC9_9BACL|nr:DMT family transporter [Cohnella pontilimi]TJY42926.1 DMT family transporter [Cohnella pontilimi]